MKAIIQSLSPVVCERIANGEQSIIVAKTAPKEVPFKDYVYCTKKGKIFFHGGIGEKEVLFYNPDEKKYKFDYSFELMGCKNEYTEDNFLSGKVIGEFICDRVDTYDADVIACTKWEVNGGEVKEHLRYNAGACLTAEQMFDYSKGKSLYGLHISDLKIYDKPKELGEFYTLGNCEKYDFCNQCKNFHRGQGWLDGSYCDEDSCLDNTRIPVTRAPKSWQYVEEL